MPENIYKLYKKLKNRGLSPDRLQIIERELEYYNRKIARNRLAETEMATVSKLYDANDFELFIGIINNNNFTVSIQTLDDLLERDKKREEDGFPRKIRIGKFIKPEKYKKEQIVVVPTTN